MSKISKRVKELGFSIERGVEDRAQYVRDGWDNNDRTLQAVSMTVYRIRKRNGR